MKLSFSIVALACSLHAVHPASFTTSVVQGVGQNWNAAIWVPEGGGAAVGPAAGNTYTVVDNGVTVRNLSANARTRNPTAGGEQTFPGDSLVIATNAELRLKVGPAAVVFPGVDGQAGLVLDGGVINIADNGAFTIRGAVEVRSALLLNAVNDHGGSLQPTRGLNLQARLTGSGDFIIFNSHTNTPHRIAHAENTFHGRWIVTSGRLLGEVHNALGTNDIVIDPFAVLNLDPELLITPGPAVLEVNYDLNSAGSLTLANGGLFHLHQNTAFRAVTIEGTALTPGTHFYDELAASFPNNFPPGGSGAITVQPYGQLPVFAPEFTVQPTAQRLYAGSSFTLRAAASGAQPMNYQWRVFRGGSYVDVQDGNGISGAQTSELTFSNLTADQAGDYVVVATNNAGTRTSAAANVALVAPTGADYETAIMQADPVVYYRLSETEDPGAGATAFDFAGGFHGMYGAAVQNGHSSYNIAGPVPADNLPGFEEANEAAMFSPLATGGDPAGAFVSLPPWRLNTNAVTFTAWIHPFDFQGPREAVVFSRAGATIAGIYYSGVSNPNGTYSIGYNWNDDGPTFNWNSGLEVPVNQWSFVALVVTPTNATIYLINTNSYRSAVNIHNHAPEPFDGEVLIGNDPLNLSARAFNGRIDEVAVFNRSLSASEVLDLFEAAAGSSSFAPTISVQPVGETVFAGQTARLSVVADGNPAPAYRWQSRSPGGVFTDLNDGGRISGATAATLVISGVQASDGLEYRVVVSNGIGSATSDPATVTVQPTGPPLHITMDTFQPIGINWDTVDYWSDGKPASLSAVSNPGSTYEILPGGRMRSPDGALDSTFPGDVLIVSGDGVFANNPAPGNSIGEIRFKQGGPVGIVRFKKLVMNGGQLDATNPNVVELHGHIDIQANTPIYNDTTADRGCRIAGWLTGDGSIEYHAYNRTALMPNFIYNLDIAGTSNTFSGKWNIVLGVLLGSAPNSLGTNDITIGAEGVLETTYDINNPRGSLILDGKVYLHQNYRFRSVVINGASLAPGVYTFAELSAQYPANFPASWTQQFGSTFSTASGSITVLGEGGGDEVRITVERDGTNLRLTWPRGQLQSADAVTGGWTTLENVNSPATLPLSDNARFFRVFVQP